VAKNKLVYHDAKTKKDVDVIPEGKDELLAAQIVGNKIVAHYLNDACSQLKVFDLDGKHLRDIELPGRGTVKAINGSASDKELLFTYTDFTTPSTPYRCNLETGKIEAQFTPRTPFNPKDFETEEKVCKSKDGTPVHLFIVHKKGMQLDGNNPTYLHGYGGFKINRTPQFDNGNIPWLQDGGVLCVANLRGGNEYGAKWHEAGMKDKKQNVFDDFIASAQYLVDNHYTNGSKLAIGGRSNGGLLVGATLVQRPDLFAAAIPEVGLFDMLRFPKIGPGAWWESEYGYPSNPDDFKTFMKYSPLHNLKRGIGYPAVLTMTNVNDDRVIPSHSFKFVAAAQRAQGNEKNPVLLYVGQGCGHGPEKYTRELIEEYANKWAFLKQAMRNAEQKK
jgi:prolyl oligopeptidase